MDTCCLPMVLAAVYAATVSILFIKSPGGFVHIFERAFTKYRMQTNKCHSRPAHKHAKWSIESVKLCNKHL